YPFRGDLAYRNKRANLYPSSSAIDPLFGCTEVRAKLVVQFDLNTTISLVNLVYPKLVGRLLPQGIAECYNTLQQLVAATLQKISRRNGACEGVCKDHNLDARP